MVNTSTLYEAFMGVAKEHPDYVAFYYKQKAFSYKHVLKKVNTLAKAFLDLGYKKGDVITVVLPNIPAAIYCLYAINQIGAIANMIHPLMEEPQLEEILFRVKSDIVFTLDTNISKFKSLTEKGITLVSCCPTDELIFFAYMIYQSQNKKALNEGLDVDCLSFSDLVHGDKTIQFDSDYKCDSIYMHSGGTTGKSKTIALSSFAINSLCQHGLHIVDEKDPKGIGMLSVLPLFHGFGLAMGVHVCLSLGGTDVLVPKFNTKEVLKYLKKDRLHLLIGVPVLYEALLRKKEFSGKTIKNLKCAFVGGDFVSNSLLERFNKRMIDAGAKARLFEGYGLTETVTVCTVNIHPDNKDHTVGKPIPGVKVKAVDMETGVDLPNEKEGELYISGDTLMNGYRFEKEINDPFIFDKDGTKWVKSGDYGKVDKDGFVIFEQRIKRIVKVNGINIFPGDIEHVVCDLPYVFECCAKGVSDPKFGNVLNLYIVLDKKCKEENHDEEIKKLIKDKCSIYAVPKKIIYLDAFPKTLIGKIDEKNIK